MLVEDASELRPEHHHVVALEARPANIEGAGEVTLRTLVRQALRMRPDRLVVGEVRGAEVVDMLAAMNTGHEGGCATVHANSAADVPSRIEGLALAAGLSRQAVHSQLSSALDVVVHLGRGPDHTRRVREIGVLPRPRRVRGGDARGPVLRRRRGRPRAGRRGADRSPGGVNAGRGRRPRCGGGAARRAGSGPAHLAAPRPRRHDVAQGLVVLPVAALVAASAMVLRGTHLVLAVIALASAWAVAGILRRRREARVADRRAGEVLALSEAMAADLSAGQPPLLVLQRAADEWPEFAPVAVAGQMGADVPMALRELARRPGGQQLWIVAATWQVAHHTGAGLAGALARAADTMRAERRTARLVATELAAARATARMLALLPVGVLVMGMGIGGTRWAS